MYTPKIYAFITAGDSDTVRGTLITPQATAGANTTTTYTGRGATLALADGVVVQPGDRLVIEVGFLYVSGTAGSPRLYYGGTATPDLTEGSTSTTIPGHAQLSSDWDFVFQQPPVPSPAVAHYAGDQGWDTTTTLQTATISAAANDLLVLYAMTEASQWSWIVLPSGGGLTWAEEVDTGAASSGQVAFFSAKSAGTVTSQQISINKNNAASDKQGIGILRVANASIGAKAFGSNAVDNEPNIAITTTAPNSGVIVEILDWGASDGQLRTWKTVNGFTPAYANAAELLYFRNPVDYTVYCAWYPDVGAIGTYTVGLTNMAVGNFTIAAMEIKQDAGGGGLIRPRPKPIQIGDLFRRAAVHRAANY